MTETAEAVRRLHWGCGENAQPGWINSDLKGEEGVDLVCDIREGLPLESGTIDYAVSIHALPEFPYPQLVPVLVELRRVLRDGGVLRLGLPDFEKTIRAYIERDVGFFLVPDDEVRSLGGKFAVHATWYGYTRSIFTFDFVEELLYRAGFRQVTRCSYQQTASEHPAITELDNREEESLFVEAER